ncbi:MAG TPA: trypsin-like peptidase domain-containing protein [Bacteroidia bacterium]|jgi:hypothetical protein|nr:trypsin-like peptidase domain-containing protein [Bacteroidia bacterium]
MDKEFLSNLSYATFLSLNHGSSAGSGFRLSYKGATYLITAKHVLFDEKDDLRCETLLITSQNSRGVENDIRNIVIDMMHAKTYKSDENDIAAVLIETADYITVQQEGENIINADSESTRPLDQIGISNEVFLVGFPTSLIFQDSQYFEVNRPLLRKGIIAGVNAKNKTFIIDCSAYYGNSGGPIIELCEDGLLRLIGIVSRYIPFVTEWKNNREPSISHTEFYNSGYSVCVPIDAVFLLLDGIAEVI